MSIPSLPRPAWGPPWVLAAVIGWALTAAGLAAAQRAATCAAAVEFRALVRTRALPRTWTPSAPLGPRDLRAAPGIGPALAVDVARWLWAQHGTPGAGWDTLAALPGLGALRTERLRALAPGAPRPLGAGPPGERTGGEGR